MVGVSKKMFQSKKGKVILYISTIGFIISLVTFFFFISQEKTKGVDYELGEDAINVLKTFQETDKVMIFFDHSVQNSLEKSIFDLTRSGGLNESSKCFNSYGSYELWQKKSQKCYPTTDEVKITFQNLFLKNFKEIISSGPNNLNLEYLIETESLDPLEVVVKSSNPMVVKEGVLFTSQD